jgi:signal transduction histidine kinase
MNKQYQPDCSGIDQKEGSEHLAVFVHELRAPLVAIRGYAELLENELGAAEQKVKATRIRSLTERVETLISNWLEVKKLEGEESRPVRKEIKLQPLLRQILQDLEPQITAKRHGVSVEKATCPIIRTDPELLTSVLIDLLANAIHYTPPGGEIALRVREHDGTVRIEIQDNGIGIAPEEQARIFEAFYRTSVAERMEERGSGLGLYITKRRVEKLGGSVCVHSQGKDKGSTFSVELPLSSVADSL